METKIDEKLIEKYFNSLVKLHDILKVTNKISMAIFISENHLNKETSRVLKEGGIVRLQGAKKGACWYWNTIPPTKHMAVETIKRLTEKGKIQTEKRKRHREKRKEIIQKKTKQKTKIENKKTTQLKNKYLDSITFKIFFIKITIKLNYTTNP